MAKASYYEANNPPKLRHLRPHSIILTALLALSSLTAVSQKKKNSPFSNWYHDLVTRYNGYFNAKLILFESLAAQTAAAQDDYTKLLPLHPYEGVESKAIYGDLDKIIKKGSVAIRLHPNSKWVDDCYVLIGKAKYLRGDYPDALAAFQTVTSKYSEGIREKMKKRSKKKIARQRRKEEAGKNIYYDAALPFMVHKPAKWKAMIGIVRCYSAMGKLSEAQRVLSLIEGDKVFPDQLQQELQLAVTEMFIKGERYDQAVLSLTKAIAVTKKKSERARYTFILGQLQELSNQVSPAVKSFASVLAMKPGYEMEFQAEMRIVRLSAGQQGGSDQAILAQLTAMLKNEKYREYLDEVYYAIAEVYLARPQVDSAITNLNKSIAQSRIHTHPGQQAKSYLKLADIYFEQEDYPKSKAYHDSTLAILTSEDPDFARVNKRKNILSDLVMQIRTVERQDSLQWLSGLDSVQLAVERKKWEEEHKKKPEGEPDGPGSTPLVNTTPSSSTAFFFYDPVRKAQGYEAFKRFWGERVLADNWRRSSASTFTFNEPDVDSSDQNGAITANQTGELFKDIPRTPEELEASHKLILEALYAMAYIYKDELENNVKAIETFEELLKRYPRNPYRAEVLYNLYVLYTDTDKARARQYADSILSEYPDSIYAKLIRDPGFISDDEKVQKDITSYYAATYGLFEEEQWTTVIERKMVADSLFKGNHLKPKFDMLEALSFGKLGRLDTFQVLLEAVVNNHPQDEVKNRALEILHLLEEGRYTVDSTMSHEAFRFEASAKHYVAVVMHEVGPRTGQVKNGLSDYNSANHSLEGLKVSSLLLNNESEMIVINAFNDAAKATEYYNEIRYNETVFGGISRELYTVFPISEVNYGIFFRTKDIPAYMQFFTQNYLGNN